MPESAYGAYLHARRPRLWSGGAHVQGLSGPTGGIGLLKWQKQNACPHAAFQLGRMHFVVGVVRMQYQLLPSPFTYSL